VPDTEKLISTGTCGCCLELWAAAGHHGRPHEEAAFWKLAYAASTSILSRIGLSGRRDRLLFNEWILKGLATRVDDQIRIMTGVRPAAWMGAIARARRAALVARQRWATR